ncbi:MULTISPECIES: class I mannose-6-phosphate isomerase [Prauserella salsuginis group]|uniref:Mannose-6-phosphate isomerase n=2 Tax=Prauserella salsuginis group TaxID=2893672 RepID=A0A839XZS8_9PSEU|nr:MULTISPECIES: class I mannose-6-phosphate isomerase [Prauserella salsuginis group]MBB3665893.1 mannose-6-phosphate isomerase [Prauserella sediminis]MCR3718878.1 mannose-6-phosphate isomerase [Prauserella flava]MCR3733448.1 mannose-6-phosphate isomerase [Prauserella salsuginis]
MPEPLEPIVLPANQPPQFYRGGAAIAALRGDETREYGPEDWVASTTTRFTGGPDGLTRLPDGRWLADAVTADPRGWLGDPHLRRFGDSTALLVKLLDAGQRLPVHFHPDDRFARAHFDSHFGKTEAWIVVGASGDDPTVYTGFRETLPAATVRDWVRDQDAPSMLEALNAVPVAPGDTVVIPAGLPHAIGAGVFVVELQQPTDFSLTMEWRDFLDSPEQGHLGLGFDTALQVLDTSGWDEQRLTSLIRRGDDEPAGRDATDPAAAELLAPLADGFFRAERLFPRAAPAGTLTLTPGFAVLVALGGAGTLASPHGETPIARGDTVVVPYGAGALELSGDVTVLRCRPPA